MNSPSKHISSFQFMIIDKIRAKLMDAFSSQKSVANRYSYIYKYLSSPNYHTEFLSSQSSASQQSKFFSSLNLKTGRIWPSSLREIKDLVYLNHQLVYDLPVNCFSIYTYLTVTQYGLPGGAEGAGCRRRRLRRSEGVGAWGRSNGCDNGEDCQPACSRYCWLETWVAHTSAPKSSLYLCDRELERVCGKNKSNRIVDIRGSRWDDFIIDALHGEVRSTDSIE